MAKAEQRPGQLFEVVPGDGDRAVTKPFEERPGILERHDDSLSLPDRDSQAIRLSPISHQARNQRLGVGKV